MQDFPIRSRGIDRSQGQIVVTSQENPGIDQPRGGPLHRREQLGHADPAVIVSID